MDKNKKHLKELTALLGRTKPDDITTAISMLPEILQNPHEGAAAVAAAAAIIAVENFSGNPDEYIGMICRFRDEYAKLHDQ